MEIRKADLETERYVNQPSYLNGPGSSRSFTCNPEGPGQERWIISMTGPSSLLIGCSSVSARICSSRLVASTCPSVNSLTNATPP